MNLNINQMNQWLYQGREFYYNIVQNWLDAIVKDIFACLFSIHNIISLSCHEQVCLSGLRFERYFSHHRAT